jgi:hypothetical protein
MDKKIGLLFLAEMMGTEVNLSGRVALQSWM